MSTYLSSIVVILSLFLGGNNACQIQYDGIYKMEIDDEYAAYFKFFKDGKVLHTTSTSTESEVATYFNTENQDMVLVGKYTTGNCNVKGKASGMTGKISFWGTVEMEAINVTFKNPTTNSSIDGRFEFYPFEE